MDDLGYLVATYTIIWVAISGYVLRLGRKQNRLRREIDSMRKEMADQAQD